MSQAHEVEQRHLDKLLNQAIDLTDNRVSYITNIRFNISNNEVTLDMYYVSPNPGDPGENPIVQRLHRIVIPLGLAKNIGELLVNAMSDWEENFGITLPIVPNAIREQLKNNEPSDE